MKCSYCGNTSGKRDTWGGCVSCGGQDFISERTRALPISFANGFMSAEEIRLEYMGTSGGHSRKYSTILDLPEIQEGLDFSYPIRGNSHAYPSVNTIYGCPEAIYLRWRNAGGGRGAVPNWFIRDPYPEKYRDWFREWGENGTGGCNVSTPKRDKIKEMVRKAVGLV